MSPTLPSPEVGADPLTVMLRFTAEVTTGKPPAVKLPPVTLPATDKLVRVPRLVILGCALAALANAPTIPPCTVNSPLMLPPPVMLIFAPVIVPVTVAVPAETAPLMVTAPVADTVSVIKLVVVTEVVAVTTGATTEPVTETATPLKILACKLPLALRLVVLI